MNNDRKKIILAVTKSNFGGAQRYVFDIATHLNKDTYDVTVLCGGDGLLVKKLKESGIRVILLPYLTRDIKIFDELKGLQNLIKIFKEEKPDIIHLNSSKMGGLGALAGKVAGVEKIIFTAHGWPFEEKRSILWRLLAFIGSWITAFLSDIVIVVSNYDLSISRKIGFGNKTIRIYNGIGPINFGSGEVIRNSFPKDVHITGTIGELTQNKNQITLIEEAHRNKDMYVAIVGEGEDREFLSKKIQEYRLSDRVKLFGFIEASEVLKGFDTFALPSLKEGLPYVLLEAKAAGISINANKVGGVPEIIEAKTVEQFSLDTFLHNLERIYN